MIQSFKIRLTSIINCSITSTQQKNVLSFKSGKYGNIKMYYFKIYLGGILDENIEYLWR